MPEVVEAESESTARIECSFSVPGNGSYAFIDWFYVSAGTLPRVGAVVAVPGALRQPALVPWPRRWTAAAG